MKQYSWNQGVTFIPLEFDDQAYLIDNFQLMIDMLTEHLEKNPDPVHRHWLDCLEVRYKNICKQSQLER
ncbi:hypothetical protein [Aeromonas phage AS-zj]|uniref:Uncharacterized protein n=3 Tax=Ceceduovirus TaxID=2842588 RepID=A0A411B850_9CAUD|nr:hypothetical protein HWB28_gp296 [Aeromonas phage AS-zj]YP_009834829.1 hypothetical protein HWB29_gp127 [Aeromonas phage AS-sw]QAX97782.1 hypothetical protein ASswx1_137 [Aeromonas phage Asswx_1]QAX99161.1 hypothetical protein assk_381 [Aeromonas phage Assk]ASU00256.1 hypothetical protein [Aeromonas phage AS-zj]ATI18177.1 hypothetical protein [Aeromonas phage AS-sw]